MAELLGSLMLAAYSGAGRLMTPFVPSVLTARAKRGLEDRHRRGERFGYAGIERPDRGILWVHAASVGETNAVMPLVARLTEAGWFVVLTTITVTGAATAARNPPEGASHQFAPVDIKPYVARFLDHWRPRAALFVESEVWPVMTDQLSRRSIPHVIVNAHMSEKSFRRWRMLGTAPRRVFGRIDLALAQLDEDADRLKRLGVADVRTVGNLKYDAPPPEADRQILEQLRAERGDRPLLLAASTHPGEDEVVAAAHKRLLERHPALTTIIVPRHPARGPGIAAMLEQDGIGAVLRSGGEKGLPPPASVLVADTLGELGTFYRLADIAFVGGTLQPIGGHNPAEPAALEAAILHGPLTGNYASIFSALDDAGGAIAIADAASLADSVSTLLEDPARIHRQTANATRAMQPFSGALNRTLDALKPFLERGAGP